MQRTATVATGDQVERLVAQGLFPSGSLPDEFSAQIRKEVDKMQRISRFARISLD